MLDSSTGLKCIFQKLGASSCCLGASSYSNTCLCLIGASLPEAPRYKNPLRDLHVDPDELASSLFGSLSLIDGYLRACFYILRVSDLLTRLFKGTKPMDDSRSSAQARDFGRGWEKETNGIANYAVNWHVLILQRLQSMLWDGCCLIACL